MFSETLLPPAKIKVKKIIQTNKTQFSNWEGREGKELKILGTEKEDSVEVWGQLFKALVAGIWLRTAHKYIFLFPLKKPRLRSQWCVTGCTPTENFTEVMSDVQDACRAFLQTRPMVHTAGEPPGWSRLTGHCWRLSKCGSRWDKVQNRLDSTAGLCDRPWRSGNRAGRHLKKRQLGEIPLLPLWFKWETAFKLIICALSPYLGQEPKMQKAWTWLTRKRRNLERGSAQVQF